MKKKLIDINKLMIPSKFGKLRSITKQNTYDLMKRGIIDYVEIDSTKFVHLTPKTIKYKKQNFRNN